MCGCESCSCWAPVLLYVLIGGLAVFAGWKLREWLSPDPNPQVIVVDFTDFGPEQVFCVFPDACDGTEVRCTDPECPACNSEQPEVRDSRFATTEDEPPF